MKRILNKESRATIELMIANNLITKDVAEKYFPELKESEDERIRKGLIGYFRAGKCENISSYHGISTDDILVWLEKQGNLMKALQISNARIGELIEENYYLREQLEKQDENNMDISEATKQELEDNLNKALEKETPESFNEFLDEQKPADKVEPIIVRDFNSVFSKEQVEEIDKRIEKSQKLYDAKLRDATQKVKDFSMTD